MGARPQLPQRRPARLRLADEARQIQDLYLDGKKDAAAAAVPREMMLERMSRSARAGTWRSGSAFSEAGMTTLKVTPHGGSSAERVAQVEAAVELAAR